MHGGFTSAFYDFKENGTGRLVISIACWLIRKEEYYMNLRKGIIKLIPSIKIPARTNNNVFNKWIKLTNINIYSILILDVSGSMKNYYNSLIEMVNNIIQKQQKNKDNEGVVILFGTYAKTIINGKYNKLLKMEDINNAKIGIETDFLKAFKEAEKYILNKNTFAKKRVLFLTDGKADSSNLHRIINKMKKENFTINIVGFTNTVSISSFEHLRKFATENCFYTSKNFKEIKEYCQNAFAAE